MKENTALRKRILAALFLAIGLILPFITMQIPAVGKMLCPMHIPVLLCGYICGWPYGLLIGIITPLLRGVLFGMPAIFPNAFCMAFELATYGLVAGILSEKMKKDIKSRKTGLISNKIVTNLRKLNFFNLQPQILDRAMPVDGVRDVAAKRMSHHSFAVVFTHSIFLAQS